MGGNDQQQCESPRLESLDLDNQKQFVRLFVANQRRIHAFIRMLIPQAVDADDVLQETCITGLAKFSSSFLRDGKEPQHFKVEEFVAWICTIARFEALKWCRKQKRGRLLFSESLIEELAERHMRQLDYLESRHDALKGCLEKLTSTDRKLLLFRYDANLSGIEISERLGRPVNTVYKALQRIRSLLLQCVDRTIRAQGHG